MFIKANNPTLQLHAMDPAAGTTTLRNGGRRVAVFALVLVVLVAVEWSDLPVSLTARPTRGNKESLDMVHSRHKTTHNSFTRLPLGSCVWTPNDDGPCVDLLTRRLQSSKIPLNRHRWLLLGDSTMARLWRKSPLQQQLADRAPIRDACPQRYRCGTVRAGRCDINERLHIVPRPPVWKPPNSSRAEGPIRYGLKNHYCQDCSGCDTAVLSCQVVDATVPCSWPSHSMGAMYGGFISVEFARDVEVQSRRYSTTQENIVRYIHSDWNTQFHLADFGRPVCVVAAGVHDVAVPNITLALYLTNVEWYMSLLSTVCDHVVWLSNTCPATDERDQKKQQTKEWNMAVRDLLERNTSNRDHVSFVDVYDASVDYNKTDNIHMGEMFYNLLGRMFLQVM